MYVVNVCVYMLVCVNDVPCRHQKAGVGEYGGGWRCGGGEIWWKEKV